MRVPNELYTARPWRIHEFTKDFTLEDVWALPTPGGPDDLPRLVKQFTSNDDSEMSASVIRVLFAIRWKIGALLGLDKAEDGVGKRVASLRDRLPADLLELPDGPDFELVPLRSVYQTDTEYVAEMANKTCHVLMHIGWVPDGTGGYRGEMAALVKPNGLFGKAYMAGITPFRRALVVPSLIRGIGNNWSKYA
ncbi:DUF2867 domain-containing protein [Kitasatospora sp. CM 4170]|uniref:DUF2867 domain-containing protein n=1 Tax=Kitasatospora aburaviensis TaxID=67265 RepID=A0ABW1F944_9ACTN|nr:DUF2867 domain-containing protein [Kitasatospora sp. CM 4170]WNM48324.1 DUF2867 domain-containing protein [Kitasatospora sp. CM 4170]